MINLDNSFLSWPWSATALLLDDIDNRLVLIGLGGQTRTCGLWPGMDSPERNRNGIIMHDFAKATPFNSNISDL